MKALVKPERRDTLNASTNPRFNPTDQDVIARLQGGDEQEFENLLEFIIRPLCNFVLGMIRDFGTYEDAEEIVSDALRTVYYEVGERYDPQRSRLLTWIYNIAKNRAINFIRKQIELRGRARNLAEQRPKEDKRRKSFEGYSYSRQIRRLAYDTLSAEDKNILRLRLTYDDKVTAGQLNISTDAVHQRRSRAIKRWLAACEKIKDAEG